MINLERISEKVADYFIKDTAQGTLSILYYGPFNNCQTFSISNVCNLLKREDCFNILVACKQKTQKKSIMLDINESYKELLMKHFKQDDIIFMKEYTSTRGSRMIFYLLKTDHLVEKPKPITDEKELSF